MQTIDKDKFGTAATCLMRSAQELDRFGFPNVSVNDALFQYYIFPNEYHSLASDKVAADPCSYEADSNWLLNYARQKLNLPGFQTEPNELIDDLRFERYVSRCRHVERNFSDWTATKGAYYRLRGLLPAGLRRQLQRIYFNNWSSIAFPSWPVDQTVDRIFQRMLVQLLKTRALARIPFIWFWPDGAKSAAIMTHDVEALAGRKFCPSLMDMDDSFAIKASFQIVPEDRYEVADDFLENVRQRGFEINVQDLNHDGRLFDNHEQFLARSRKINEYGKRFHAKGFRSAILYRRVEWYGALDFEYDMSIPNVAHLEPQRGGCCTIFPFFIDKMTELPLTTTQDLSLFYILKDFSGSVWTRQLSSIVEAHGLASFLVHPDYLLEQRAQDCYNRLLEQLVRLRDSDRLWIALPGEVSDWWRLRSQMGLVAEENNWRIRGVGSERARIAYASLEGEDIAYTF
jgi:hypothetical protein